MPEGINTGQLSSMQQAQGNGNNAPDPGSMNSNLIPHEGKTMQDPIEGIPSNICKGLEGELGKLFQDGALGGDISGFIGKSEERFGHITGNLHKSSDMPMTIQTSTHGQGIPGSVTGIADIKTGVLGSAAAPG